MSRIALLAAAAALLLAPAARAEPAATKDVPAADAKAAPAPSSAAVGSPVSAVDPRIEALVKSAMEKARQELRDELRLEVQGAQSAAEFLGTAVPGPKLQFFEIDGYLRFRGTLKDNFDLKRGVDSNNMYLYPLPGGQDSRGTLTTADMRLRLQPTFNVSEKVRVRTMADVFDNHVFGANTVTTGDVGGTTLYNFGGRFSSGSPTQPVFSPKLAWAEVETPVGLLAFGRMPSVWGLGLVAPDQSGLDDDFGVIADRLQFTTLPLSTPLGALSLIPYLDFFASGPLAYDARYGSGAGSAVNTDSHGNGRTFGLKLARLDTPAEIRRKLDRGESSNNWGVMYEYSTLPTVNVAATVPASLLDASAKPYPAYINRNEYEHLFDGWYRHKTSRFYFEAEGTFLVGQISDPTDPWTYSTSAPASLVPYVGPQILIRQFGLALKLAYQAIPNKFTLAFDFGLASGDTAPGFGNQPFVRAGLDPNTGLPGYQPYGVLEGPQYSINGSGDHDIRNFRFAPGFRPDLILWREIIGQVTDGWYVKPAMRWDIVSGLAFDGALIYSQAIYGASTPAATNAKSVSTALGLEFDGKLTYSTDDGFSAWVQYGVLQPLDGLNGTGLTLSRAHTLGLGLAARF